jgi:uncharacterized protein (DUF58 family)
VTVTPRFLLLNAPGLALAAVAAWAPWAFALALAWHGGLLLLALADAVLGHAPGAVAATRHVGPKLSLGDEAQARVRVRNLTRRPLDLEVYDPVPEPFRCARSRGRVRLAPGGEETFRYALTPLRRGSVRFGDLWVRQRCRLGLAARRVRIPAEQEVRVLPNLEGIRRAELLGRKNRLAEAGIHRVRFVGQGTEFEQLRDYSPDDDYRRINWKATAKRSTPITAEYQVERSQNVMLCVDAGHMMGTGVGWMTKLDFAVNAAALLAHAASSGGDRVGLVIFAHEVLAHVAPSQGPQAMSRIVEALTAVQPQETRVDYMSLVRFLAVHGKRRSLLAVFTDLVDAALGRELAACLRQLRGRHLPLCLTFRDANVEDLARLRPETAQDVYVQAAAHELSRERTLLLRDLTRHGVQLVDTLPRDLSVQAVNKYLEIKGRQML